MQVSLEHRPGSVVELSIEVPAEQVERAIQRALDRLAPRVRVAGFRPGKAPREILEREIGWPALREQAIEILLPETLSQAVTEHQLQAIETPQVEVERFERLLPARFRARVTVKPDVVLGDVDAIRAPLREAVVGSDRVDAAIDEIRQSFASLVPADNRPVRDRDQVIVDLEVKKDGVPVDEQPSTNVELEVSSENLLPGLFEGLEGMSQGESKEIPLHLPDDYRRTELAGQDVIFAVTVKEVKERQLPDSDDELARLSGLGENIEELRQKVEERLRTAAERDEVFAQQKAALDALVESSKFDTPEVIVEEQVERDIRSLAVTLGRQGIDFDKFIEFGGADLEQLREERRPGARERAAQELVLDAVAEQQHLHPSDAHVDAEADRVLADSEDADRLRASDRVRAYVADRMRLQWALLWLAAKARGEAWSEPLPGAQTGDEGASAAAEELVSGEPGTSVAESPLGGAQVAPETEAPVAPPRADGMTEV